MTTPVTKKSDLILLKTISILCASIVPLLVTGPFLPDLMLSTLSIWFIYYSLKHKIYNIYKNIYFYFFIGFWLACIASSLLSDAILFSLKASLFYLRIGIFALLISYLINKNRNILDYFYYTLIITFTSLVIDGYFQYFTGFNLFGYPIIRERVSSFFGDELILGSYLARLFPLFLALFFVKPNKNSMEFFFIYILCVLISGLILISGERASFFLFILSITFIYIFISLNFIFSKFLLPIFFLLLNFFLIIQDKKLQDRFIRSPIKNMAPNSSTAYIFTEGHDALIKTAWKMFLDKPIIGHGPKLFRVKCRDLKYAYKKSTTICDVHPHNFYIQLLAETGIVGFLFLAGLFFYFTYLLIRHIFEYFIRKRRWLSNYQICLLAGLLITIWPITTNGNFFTNHLMLFYSLQIGFFKRKL